MRTAGQPYAVGHTLHLPTWGEHFLWMWITLLKPLGSLWDLMKGLVDSQTNALRITLNILHVKSWLDPQSSSADHWWPLDLQWGHLHLWAVVDYGSLQGGELAWTRLPRSRMQSLRWQTHTAFMRTRCKEYHTPGHRKKIITKAFEDRYSPWTISLSFNWRQVNMFSYIYSLHESKTVIIRS